MRVGATGTDCVPDFETLAAMTEAAAPQPAAAERGPQPAPRSWAPLSAAFRDAVRVDTGRLKPATRALAEKAINRLCDGSVDAASSAMIACGLRSLGSSKESMGLDCSGFVKHLANRADAPIEGFITAPGKNGCTQMKGSFEPVDPVEAQTGDLIFFNDRTDPQKTASHVGIVIVAQDGERLFLHMTNHGVDINRLTDVASNETKARWGSQFCGYARNPAVSPS
jgi:cell wall-associated NlpC family hydrolase